MLSRLPSFHGFNVTFHLTEACNLKCNYCYEYHKRDKDLPLEYAKLFIDLLLTEKDIIGKTDDLWTNVLGGGLIMDFIGGDALMRPKLCDEIMKYMQFKTTVLKHKWAHNYRMNISTNGTLFGNQDVRDFIEKYLPVLSIGVSVDGCPEIHNKLRSNSMSQILKHWDYFLSITGDHASTKSTLTNESIPYLVESVRYLHETLKLKYINMNFIFDKQDSEPDLIELDKQLKELVSYVYAHKDDLYLSLFDKDTRCGRPYKDNDLTKTWCGSGGMPCLDVDGKIYPCFRFAGQNKQDPTIPDFNVGDVWNGFYKKDRFELIRGFTRERISPEKCKVCDVESSCAWCIAGAYTETGKFYRQTYVCEIQKLQAKYANEYWRVYHGTNRRSI